MKRPSFQFYPADWRNNAKLRRCSEAARGAWMDVLCVLHDFDEYGICRWPLADLARAANVGLKLIKELVTKDVLKGADRDADPYIFTPRHAGKDGTPVILVENNGGPVWYCTRFVRDEYIRQRRGQSTRFDEENQPPKIPPKTEPNIKPKGGIGEDLGDGSTSSSTSTLKPKDKHTVSKLDTSQQPTIAGSVCLQLKTMNITGVNPTHPKLLGLIEAGASLEEFVDVASTVTIKKFSYVIGAVDNMRKQAAEATYATGKAKPKGVSFNTSQDELGRRAKELGISTYGKSDKELIGAINAKLGVK